MKTDYRHGFQTEMVLQKYMNRSMTILAVSYPAGTMLRLEMNSLLGSTPLQ